MLTVHAVVSGAADNGVSAVATKETVRAPPDALSAAIAEFIGLGWLVVASAGNDTSCRPLWPAALPGVISVAAIDQFGPASFTNFGPWVSACAPGVGVLSVLPDPYVALHPALLSLPGLGTVVNVAPRRDVPVERTRDARV